MEELTCFLGFFFGGGSSGEQLMFLWGYFSHESIAQLGLQHSCVNGFPGLARVSALQLKSGNEQKEEQKRP